MKSDVCSRDAVVCVVKKKKQNEESSCFCATSCERDISGFL